MPVMDPQLSGIADLVVQGSNRIQNSIDALAGLPSSQSAEMAALLDEIRRLRQELELRNVRGSVRALGQHIHPSATPCG